MPLVRSQLTAMHDGDRVWFAMLDDGKPVDCYVEQDVLERLSRDQRRSALDEFNRYRPVFEVMLNDRFVRGKSLVVAAESVTRWEL